MEEHYHGARIYFRDNKVYHYDAILPESVKGKYPLIYPSVLADLFDHQKKFPFKLHQHFNHMASSQAANANLSLPVLLNPLHDRILQQLKPDLDRLATDELYKGFRIEFWDGNSDEQKGLLKDHTALYGTDADIAIAYYNSDKELCLWLIEHKLTEKEFTTCGGAKSRGKRESHQCNRTFRELIANKSLCYYHDVRGFDYWNLTEKYQSLFRNASGFNKCPFIGGMNQLWRNQLLAMALEETGKYKKVYFSVVRHPDNTSLNETIKSYKELTGYSPMFSDFTSLDVIDVAKKVDDGELTAWSKWYCDLYAI